MRYYFHIQFLRINRWSREIGLHPAFLWIGGLLAFITAGEVAYVKTQFAGWLIAAISLMVHAGLLHNARLQWIEISFQRRNFRRLRLLEHLIVALPFVAILLAHGNLVEAGSAIIFAAVSSLLKSLPGRNRSMPTPFSKWPFEFASGFRKIWPVIGISYALTTIAILKGNANLGVFAIVLLYFILMTNYSKPEARLFAWIHSMSAKQFIYTKLRIAFRYSIALGSIHMIPLIVAFPDHTHLYFLAMIAGLGFMAVSVLSKYAYFPSQIPIAPAIAVSLSVLFPPLMLLTIPFLYKRSEKQIQLTLP